LLKSFAKRTWTDGVKVIETSRGILKLDYRNYVDRQIAFYGDFEASQLSLFLGKMRERGCDVFLDIGANIGVYSVGAQLEGKPKRTIAFEPDQRNMSRLKENLALNGLTSRVEITNKAVSAESGIVSFLPAGETVTGKSRVGQGADAIQLDAVALDDLFDFKNKRLFIKIDIEEHELKAVMGMTRLLSENRVFLQIECFDENLSALTDALTALGFTSVNAIDEDRYFSNDGSYKSVT